MKVKLKKSVDIPPEIRRFTDRVLVTPLDSIADALSGFTWKYEKGDFYQWVPLFNYFDDFFNQNVRGRSDLNLRFWEGEKEEKEIDPPFPLRNTLAVLRVTARILENCTNKHLYQSYEHLTDLLAASEQEVVIAALQALVAFLRRTHHSSVRFHGYPKLNARLFDLCRGWGGKEEGLDLVPCVNEDENPLKEFIAQGTTLHFEFYADSWQDKGHVEPQEASGSGLQIIHMPRLDRMREPDHDILRQIIRLYRVPVELRFRLLTRIRIAHGFGTLEGRRHLVFVRLLAFCVLFQSNPLHEEMLSFFLSEPEFMNELVGLVQMEDGIPLELRTYALRALAVQLVDRSRHAAVINAIGVGGQNGVLSVLLQDSINYVTDENNCLILSGSGVKATDKKPKYNSSFVEALLSLVGALVSSSSGSVALSEAGFIPALLPLIQDSNPSHVNLVCTAVKILEAFMDFSSPASAMFRGLGGLTYMIKRLESEVMVVVKEPPEKAGGATDEGTSAQAEKQQQQEEEEERVESETQKQIPYTRRLLLKSLLRAIALASYAPTSGTGRRPDEADSQTLFTCLRTMFEHSKEFGGALFALSASVVTDLIHHDPLCYRSLHDVGVPEAFLRAVQEGVLPSSEAVCCVPNTLVALCLSGMGLELVQSTRALDCLISIFTSKQYLKALSGDTASILGAGIDELLRHVPALRDEGISVVITICQAICIMGGDTEIAAQLMPDKMETEQPQTSNSGLNESGDVEMGSSGDLVEALLTTAIDLPESPSSLESVSFTPQHVVFLPDEVWSRSKEKGIDPTLPECISHATKMLESLLSNQETSRRVVENGGIDLLLRMYRLPRMPPAFGSSSHSHTMLQIFRAITPSHQQDLSKKVKDALAAQLKVSVSAAENIMGMCVPVMEANARDHYVRLIASAGGLTGIAAMVARSAIPMLVEICSGEPSLMANLGQLERMVMSQLAEADQWKERRDKEKKEKEKNGFGEGEPSTPVSTPSADVTMAGTEEADRGEMVLDAEAEAEADGDADPDQMEMDSVEILRAGNGRRLSGARLTDHGTSTGSRGRKKKSQEDVAYDVLQHFVVTVRSFYMAVAKSIHTPARRREESFSQPTMPMRAATLGLALVLKNNLDHDALRVTRNLKKSPDEDVQYYARKSQHLLRLTEEVMTVLFDNRRHYCHTLILNYFVAVGGMTSLARRFQDAMDMLWEVVECEKSKKAASSATSSLIATTRNEQRSPGTNDGGTAATAAAGSSSGQHSGRGASFLESVNHLANLISGDASPLRVVEGLTLSMLSLFEQLTNPRLLCQSTQSATLMTVPLPSTLNEEEQTVSTIDAETFIKDLQGFVLGAVMPIWMNPLLPFSSSLVTSSVISILNSCSDGSVAAALRSSGAMRQTGTGRAAPDPDHSIVQQICEMGFTAARAEEALRRVGDNSVELAMDWLIAHPEEPSGSGGAGANANATPAAGTATAGASAVGDQQSTEDQILAQALAASLSKIRTGEGSGPSCSEEPAAAEIKKTEIPKPVDLVSRAVAVLEKMPVAAFSLTDLLITLCNRDGGKDRGVVLMYLVTSLMGDEPVEQAVRLPTCRLNASAHLLAILLSESPQCREVAAEKGVVQVVLDMLQAWEAEFNPITESSKPPPKLNSSEEVPEGSDVPEVPMWVEALLLILDVMAQTQPKQSQRGASSRSENTLGSPLYTPGPDAVGLEKVPGLTALLSTWQPCGLLSVDEDQVALQVCIRLLKHLHTYGKQSKSPGVLVGDQISQPDPAATTQAVLQVMARLTRCHKQALEVLHSGAVDYLLTLPAACLLPKNEVYISTILKHILEDPGTLQAYMEAEIKNLLTSRNRHNLGPHHMSHMGHNSSSASTMPVRTFLQNMSSIVNRNPKVFMEAVSSTCSMEGSSGANGRQVITLKKSKSSNSDGKDASQTPQPHKLSKSGKKVVPLSFVEVIDKLLDVIYNFDPSATEKASKEEGKAATKEDSLTAVIKGAFGGGDAGMSDMAEQINSDADPFPEMTQWLLGGRRGSNGHMLQAMALRILSDFCLLYTSTVGVLLKRDSEVSQKDGLLGCSKSSMPLLKWVLHTHLVCVSESTPLRPGVSEEASRFLQAVCIRSTEGRRRIITEVVTTINKVIDGGGNTGEAMVGQKGGQCSVFKIREFIDLIGSLLSASSGNHSENRSSQTTSGLTIEMIRSMREGGVVSALTKALSLFGTGYPDAPKAINAIIKPLEVLTRTIPAPSKRSSGSVQQGGQAASAVAPGPTPVQESIDNGAADGSAVILRGQGDELVNYESEAEPHSMAGHMMEDVMEDFVETLRDIIDDDSSPLAEDDDDEMDEDVERLGDPRLGSLVNSRLDPTEVLDALRSDAGDANQDHDEDGEAEHDDGDHVVVDEGDDDDESEEMGHEEEGDSERSRSPEGVLDEDEDIEDEDEDDEGEEGSADMELDHGDDWDDEDSREYAEALDRIEGELQDEASNLARGYVRLQPHLRSMFGSLLGNFVSSGLDARMERRGFRYRTTRFDRFDRSNAAAIPYHPSLSGSQHRLLLRPPAPPPNSSSSRAIGGLGDALIGAAPSTSEGGLGWRRIAFSSAAGGDGMNALPEGDNGVVAFRMDDQVRPLRRMGGVGGWQLMTGINPSPVMGMEYRPGREPTRNSSAGSSSWLSGLQGTLEQHIVEMLREGPPPAAPQPDEPQPEANIEVPASATEDGDLDDLQVDPSSRTEQQPEHSGASLDDQPSGSVGNEAHQSPGSNGDDAGPSPETTMPVQMASVSSVGLDDEHHLEGTVVDQGLRNPEAAERPEAEARRMDASVPEQPVESGIQALTPEFVHHAIQNTLMALAGFSGNQSGEPDAGQGEAVPGFGDSSGIEQGLEMPEQSHPIDEDEDEEMVDTVAADQEEEEGPIHPNSTEELENRSSLGEVHTPDNAGEPGANAAEEGEAAGPQSGGDDETGPALDPEIMERAQASGIDPTFLQALPRNLQIEVLSQHGVSVSTLVNSSPPTRPATAATDGPQATASPAEGGQSDQVDPEFLAALPPDIREEVLETQRLGEQRREVERQLAQGGPDDVANIVASLPEDIREEVLLYSGPDILANLPPDLIAEGQRLRDRHLQHADHDDAMARNFFFRRLRQERDQGNAHRGTRGPSGSYGVRKEKRDEMEGPPSLNEAALVTLVGLLRQSHPLHKGHLQKLFLNLCSRSEIRCTILRLLLRMLTESSRVGADSHGTCQSPSSPMIDRDHRQVPGKMDLGESSSDSPNRLQGTPPTVTRRILDLLSYLARHQNSKVAESFLELEVALPDDCNEATSGQIAMGKLPAHTPGEPKPTCGALEVLLRMLGQPLCQRSVSTLEQNLHLLEVVMQCATSKVAQVSAQAQAQAKAQEAQEAALAAAEVTEAAQASARGGESQQSQQAEEEPREAIDTASAHAPQEAEPREEISRHAQGRGSSGGAATVQQEPRSVVQAQDEGPSEAVAGPSTSQVDQAVTSLWELPESLLGWLPGLLGRRGLSDRAYRTCSSVVKLLVEAAPTHRVFILSELQKEATILTASLIETLHRIGSHGIDGSSTMANTVGSTGALILRILHAVESLIKVKQKGEAEGTQEVAQIIQQVAIKLEPLWSALSCVIGEIEKKIRHSAESQIEANAAAKILPPGAAQILPLVESFFVLCSAQGCLPVLRPQASTGSDLGRVASVDIVQRDQAHPSPSSSSQDVVVSDNSQPLMKFAEVHRVMLNAFLRQTPTLLEESLSPLLRAPRLIDFDNKRLYFRSKVRSEERHYGTLRITVRREHVFEDSFHQLRHRALDELRCKLSVQFTGEEGIDAGGVSREWYQVMSREIFNPNLALFVAVPEGSATFQPNPNSIIQNDRGVNHLDFFKFVGRILGKALYDGQLVDVHFTRSFYKHMLNLALTYEDLEAVDPEYYKQMKWTLENDITEVLDQTFAAEVDFFGRKELVELKPEGGKAKVTEENKKEYVNLMTKHKMTTAIREQIQAFQKGFWELVPQDLISIFNDHELELLISGLPEVDIGDLKANTEYSGYTAASAVIQWFWEVVEEMGKEELALLLQFVTGTSKVPLEGFVSLQGISGPQKFQIHKSYAKADRLPSAHTCFNQLDLPEYPSKEKLKDRLLVAIHEGREGFGFG